MTHQETRDLYLRYRERARELYASPQAPDHPPLIAVPQHAPVQICEDGAYVEAIVWVPSERHVAKR